jgi:hypothetical protein
LEYVESDDVRVLVRCVSGCVVSCGFDLTPEKAADLGHALIKHGEALMAQQKATEPA